MSGESKPDPVTLREDSADEELEAMAWISEELSDLPDTKARCRVLRYMVSRWTPGSFLFLGDAKP